jgi:hypothetical protein
VNARIHANDSDEALISEGRLEIERPRRDALRLKAERYIQTKRRCGGFNGQPQHDQVHIGPGGFMVAKMGRPGFATSTAVRMQATAERFGMQVDPQSPGAVDVIADEKTVSRLR